MVTLSSRWLDGRVRWASLVGALSAWLLTAPSCSSGPAPPAQTEKLGQPQCQVISGHQGSVTKGHFGRLETQEFLLKLEAGRFLHLEIEQQGIDLEASFIDPGGAVLVNSDRPSDDQGSETLLAFTPQSGTYHVRLKPVGREDCQGDYSLRVEGSRPATAADRARAAAAGVFSRAEGSRRSGDLGKAQADYEAALAQWSDLRDEAGQGECLERLGRVSALREDWGNSAQYHKRAAELFRQTGHALWEGVARHHVGLALFNQGAVADCVPHYQAALNLRQAVGDHRGEIRTLHSLAQAFQVLDEIQLSLDHYRRALQLASTGDTRLRAHSLHNLGVLYLNLGWTEEARDYLDEAGQAWKQCGDEVGRAASLSQLGEVHLLMGDTAQAQSDYREALQIRRTVRDARGITGSLGGLGRVLQKLGQSGQAEAAFREALKLAQAKRYPRSEAVARLNLGSLWLDQRDYREALSEYRLALELFERSGDITGQGECLGGIAKALRGLGRLHEASAMSARSLRRFELVRPRALSLSLRASFFSTVQQHFDSHIAILMELAQQEPGRGWEAQALATAEQARARSLMDVLAAAPSSSRELLEKERSLYVKLNRLEERRLRLADSPAGAAKRPEAERAVRETLTELDHLRNQSRDSGSSTPDSSGRPLAPAETRRQVLEPGTVLLEYRLGQEASYLWLLSQRDLRSFRLPPRKEVEAKARRMCHLLANSNRREAQAAAVAAAEELSDILISPAAPFLHEDRILIVAEGALLDVPFAALPDPRSRGSSGWQSSQPLLARHEIVCLPSASTVAALRRFKRTRPAATKWLAVVADPVFAESDPRLPSIASSGSGRMTANEPPRPGRGDDLPRLAFSEEEARSVLSLAPEALSSSVVGFQASKTWALSRAPSNYRVLHFSTHAVIHPQQPQLSALALSRMDEQGRPQDGFLRCFEISRLDLACDLVTLAACRTAAGRETRGEGAQSISAAFLRAGVRSVLVSLWNIDDRASAELMRRFYGQFFKGRRSASAALRAAQLEMSHEPAWSAPYYWAGFAVQGDWQVGVEPR